MLLTSTTSSLCVFWPLIQSTTGAALASMLGVPLLSLDTVMWKPGWGQCPPDEFRAAVGSFIDEHQESGWIADGNYMRRGGLLLREEATDIVCK